MTNVVELHPVPRDGELSFMLCSCTAEGVPFAVAAVASDKPFVSHLKCPECESEVPVVDGYIAPEGH